MSNTPDPPRHACLAGVGVDADLAELYPGGGLHPAPAVHAYARFVNGNSSNDPTNTHHPPPPKDLHSKLMPFVSVSFAVEVCSSCQRTL
jgi:hypothetical protein